MEISMYLGTKDVVGYMEISIPCHVSFQGTLSTYHGEVAFQYWLLYDSLYSRMANVSEIEPLITVNLATKEALYL